MLGSLFRGANDLLAAWRLLDGRDDSLPPLALYPEGAALATARNKPAPTRQLSNDSMSPAMAARMSTLLPSSDNLVLDAKASDSPPSSASPPSAPALGSSPPSATESKSPPLGASPAHDARTPPRERQAAAAAANGNASLTIAPSVPEHVAAHPWFALLETGFRTIDQRNEKVRASVAKLDRWFSRNPAGSWSEH